MPKLKTLSGKEVIKILVSFGFDVVSQRGSHVKLRQTKHGNKQVLAIPNHVELSKGTLKAIFGQASKYISEEELRPHFYTN